MHPAQHQALRTLIQNLGAQIQGAHQTYSHLVQIVNQLTPPQTLAAQAHQQQFDGGGQYMSPQEEAVLSQGLHTAQQQAQLQAQQAIQQAAAGVSHHFGGGGTPRRPFTPPGAIPQQQQFPQQPQGPAAFQSPAGNLFDSLGGMDGLFG